MTIWSCDYARLRGKLKTFISITTILVAAKLGKLGIYNEALPSINPHNPLVSWYCKVTWNIRSVIALLQQGLWPSNLVRWWLTVRNVHQRSYKILWICGQVYAHQTWKGWVEEFLSITWEGPLITWSCKVIWQFNYVIFSHPEWLWLPNLTGFFIQWKASFNKVTTSLDYVDVKGHVTN